MSDTARQQLASAYLATFDRSQPGLMVLDDLHRQFDDFNTFDADPYRNAFNSGKREVVRYIKRQLGIAQQPPEDTND